MVETTGMGVQIFGESVKKNIDHQKAFRAAIAGVAPPDWLIDEDKALDEAQTVEQGQLAGGALAEAGAIAQTQMAIAAPMQKAAA